MIKCKCETSCKIPIELKKWSDDCFIGKCPACKTSMIVSKINDDEYQRATRTQVRKGRREIAENSTTL